MPPYTRTWLKDVNARVHIADADDFINIHIVVTADACELVGECDVNSTECVLNNLGHLCSSDVGNDNVALTEGCIT